MTIISLPANKMASTITVPNGGTNITGQVLYSPGTGTNWAVPNTGYEKVMTVNPGDPEPNLTVKGKMIVNGIDLEERLSTIEKVLQIPERDVILEKKYPKLKKLYDEYITALEKYRTFESIKGEDDVA
jgi:hypothetical protein